MPKTLLTVAVSAALLLAGCSSPGKALPPEWKGRDVEGPGWTSTTVPEGGSFSLEYVFMAGQTVDWDWVALTDGYPYFQLIRMENGTPRSIGGQTNNHGKADDVAIEKSGTHYFVWDFDLLPATKLHYNLPEGGIPRHWPAGAGPGCPPAALLLAC